MVGDAEDIEQTVNTEKQDSFSFLSVRSTAATPDQITEKWKTKDVILNNAVIKSAPKLRVRVCSSVEKHAAVQRVEQQQERALAQAQQAHTLVLEGLEDDEDALMGEFKLMEGKVVSGRAVWQQDGLHNWFLYYACSNKWLVSDEESMENGIDGGWAFLETAALTPDQSLSAEVWEVSNGGGFMAELGAKMVRRSA
jgi:hypothetical protein